MTCAVSDEGGLWGLSASSGFQSDAFKFVSFSLARISLFEVRASFELTLWTQPNGMKVCRAQIEQPNWWYFSGWNYSSVHVQWLMHAYAGKFVWDVCESLGTTKKTNKRNQKRFIGPKEIPRTCAIRSNNHWVGVFDKHPGWYFQDVNLRGNVSDILGEV